MNKEDFIKITKDVYQLTLLFPKKEPLRFKIRELADDILKNTIFILNTNPNKPRNLILEVKKNLETLNSFFEVAKAQNWVSPDEVLKVQQEYSKVKGEFKKLSDSENLLATNLSGSNYNIVTDTERKISSRQEKILAILKEREKLQVKDLKEIFPQLSKRTLRRDFEQLLEKRLIIRIGEKNNTFYQMR